MVSTKVAVLLFVTNVVGVVSSTSSSISDGVVFGNSISRQAQKMSDDPMFEGDICYDAETETYGACDTSRFPNCDGNGVICINRRPRRDLFYVDNRQPHYFIDYRSVLCYPDNWGGCSSCSPGRYCVSETRCILDDKDYPCADWI